MSSTYKLLVSMFLMLLFGGCSKSKYQDLHNPTSYQFHSRYSVVTNALNKLAGERIEGKLVLGMYEGEYFASLIEHVSPYYWEGAGIPGDPPESGTVGEIDGMFNVVVTAKGNETLVQVNVDWLRQVIGHHYSLSPHFRKTATVKDVKSNTYFEYLFLSRLGEVLGEKDMPPLKK